MYLLIHERMEAIRRHSSSTPGQVDPGRVESPPISRRFAPSSTSRFACSSKVSCDTEPAPSEKLSGVQFRIPTMEVVMRIV
jgi:hypothetical protein